MKRFKQKAACIVLTLIFSFSLMPAFSDHASAYEVPDESLQNIYRIVAFNSYLLGNQTYFDTDTNAPDALVYQYLVFYLRSHGGQWYNAQTEYDGVWDIPYSEFSELLDKLFAHHSDMKSYLASKKVYDFVNNKYTDQLQYDADTDTVHLCVVGGVGGGFLVTPQAVFRTDGKVYVSGIIVSDTDNSILVRSELGLEPEGDSWRILSYEETNYSVIGEENGITKLRADREPYGQGDYEPLEVRYFLNGVEVKDNGITVEFPRKYDTTDAPVTYPVQRLTPLQDLWFMTDSTVYFHLEAKEGVTLDRVTESYYIPPVYVEEGKHEVTDLENGFYSAYGLSRLTLYVYATAEQTAVNPFEDVQDDKYYYAPVLWALNHDPQITNGTDATHFSPDATCTRGQVVTFLWRAKGCPEPKADTSSFTDVNADSYCYKAVLWAVENGITNGTGATTFSPDNPCTRAQVVTFLWRAEGKPAVTGSNTFTDVSEGAYYYMPVLWAVNHDPQITNGTDANHFSPDTNCTRGQIATFLYRDMA